MNSRNLIDKSAIVVGRFDNYAVLIGDLHGSGSIREILAAGALVVFDVAVHGAVGRLGFYSGQMILADVYVLGLDRDVQIQTFTVAACFCPGCNTEVGIFGQRDGAFINLAVRAIGAGAGIIGGVVDDRAFGCTVQNQFCTGRHNGMVAEVGRRLAGCCVAQRRYTGVHLCAHNISREEDNIRTGTQTFCGEYRSAAGITDGAFTHFKCAADLLSGSHGDACHGLACRIKDLYHDLLGLSNIGYIAVGIGMRQAACDLGGGQHPACIGAFQRLVRIVLGIITDADLEAAAREGLAVGTGQLHDAAIIHGVVCGADFCVVKGDCHRNRLTVLRDGDQIATCKLRYLHVLTEHYLNLIGSNGSRYNFGRSLGYQRDIDIQLGRRYRQPTIFGSGVVFTVGLRIAVLGDLDQPVADGGHPCEAALRIGDLGVDLAVQVGIGPVDLLAVLTFVVNLSCCTLNAVGSNSLIDIAGGVDLGLCADGVLRLFLVVVAAIAIRQAARTGLAVFLFVVAVEFFGHTVLLFIAQLVFLHTVGLDFQPDLLHIVNAVIEACEAGPFGCAADETDANAGDDARKALDESACRNRGHRTDGLSGLCAEPGGVPVLGILAFDDVFFIGLFAGIRRCHSGTFRSRIGICKHTIGAIQGILDGVFARSGHIDGIDHTNRGNQDSVKIQYGKGKNLACAGVHELESRQILVQVRALQVGQMDALFCLREIGLKGFQGLLKLIDLLLCLLKLFQLLYDFQRDHFQILAVVSGFPGNGIFQQAQICLIFGDRIVQPINIPLKTQFPDQQVGIKVGSFFDRCNGKIQCGMHNREEGGRKVLNGRFQIPFGGIHRNSGGKEILQVDHGCRAAVFHIEVEISVGCVDFFITGFQQGIRRGAAFRNGCTFRLIGHAACDLLYALHRRIGKDLFAVSVCHDGRIVLRCFFLHRIQIVADGQKHAEHLFLLVGQTFGVFQRKLYIVGIVELKDIGSHIACPLLVLRGLRLQGVHKLLCGEGRSFRFSGAAGAGGGIVEGIAVRQIANRIGVRLQGQRAFKAVAQFVVFERNRMDGRLQRFLVAEYTHGYHIIFDPAVVVHFQRIVKYGICAQCTVLIDFFRINRDIEERARILLQVDGLLDDLAVMVAAQPVYTNGQLRRRVAHHSIFGQCDHLIPGGPDQFAVFVHHIDQHIMGAVAVAVGIQLQGDDIFTLALDVQLGFRLQLVVDIELGGIGCGLLGQLCIQPEIAVGVRSGIRKTCQTHFRCDGRQLEDQIVCEAAATFGHHIEILTCGFYIHHK